jgi:tetratricopeptide (TPR) repeat protein/tRNA A-37 threonylcarbamoyl transferase component Bud32
MSVDVPARQRALALFDTLIELPEADRSARLAQLRIEDAAVAAALTELLQADAQASGVLDRGVQGIVADVVETSTAPALQAATLIGDFALLRPIGRGGMGEVWLAERREGAFVQQVALKLLKRGMDSDAVTARFLQERRILAELNHPHIARFIDGGVSHDGRPYFAMEYVAGENLIEHARMRQLSVRERVRLMAAVCDAVAYAQTHLVVHRDLKPSNILIDDNAQPRVLDFGIAKLLGDSAPEATMTQTGVRALSPQYAAPEQVLGESISTATDVYALGVILFELLTGALPHQRQQMPIEALAAQVKSEQAVAPSTTLRRGTGSTSATGTTQATNSTRMAREVIGDLDTIVLTALQREPARRYATAAALAEDLRRWLDARPIAAQADTRGYRLRKFVARNRLAVGSASAVLLALLAGLTVALWQASVARQQAAVAQAQTLRAEKAASDSAEAADRTRRVKEFMMQTFVAADPMHRPDHAPQTIEAAFEAAIKRIDTDVTNDTELQIDLLDDFGEVLINQGRFDEARVLLDRSLALAEKHYPADDPVIAEALLNQSSLGSYTGRILDVEPHIERAAEILQQHQTDLPVAYSQALSGLIGLRNAQGRVAEALAISKSNVEHARKHLQDGEALVATLSNHANALLQAGGSDAEIETYSREALKESERQFGANSPILENPLAVLAQILYRQGKIDELIKVNERRIGIMRSAFPEGHPGTADVLADIGWQYVEMGDMDRARQSFDEAIALTEATDSARATIPLRYRALLEVKLGNADAALADFDRALRPCVAGESEDTLCTVVRINRAGLLGRQGQGGEAMREVEAAIAELGKRGLLNDNEYAQALEAKAIAYDALGQQDQALSTQQKAIERYIAIFGEGHAEVQRAGRNLRKLQQ